MFAKPEAIVPVNCLNNNVFPLTDRASPLVMVFPPKYAFPLRILRAYVFVMVSFVPAVGAPAIVNVDAVVVVTDVLVAAKVGIPRYVPWNKDTVPDAAVDVS